MTHRERLLTTLDHKEPDRVPIDLGAALACSINVQAYDRLKRHLGLDCPTYALHRFGQIAVIDEQILERFDVDVRKLRPGGIGEGTVAAWAESWEGEEDEWGVVWAKPAYGHAYDLDSPMRHGEPSVHDLIKYPWPDPEDQARTAGLREAALQLSTQTDFGVVLSLSLYPFNQCHMLRGFTNWLMDLAANRRFAEALLDSVTERIIAILKGILKEVGELVDVVCWGDDLSHKGGPMIDPQTYRQVLKLRQRRIMDEMKRGTKAKVYFHSCGSVYWLIGDLVDLGVDILNPIQVNAADMNTGRLKKEFGQHSSFWGGGCDSSSVLPFGTPEQVRTEVRQRIEDLSPGGGFVFAPIHHIESEVPPENILSMYEAALEFGVYNS